MGKKRKNSEFIVVSKAAIDDAIHEIEKELSTITRLHTPDGYNHIYDEMITRRLVRARAKTNLLYKLGIITYKQKRDIDEKF